MDREHVLAAYDAGRDVVVELVNGLSTIIARQAERIVELERANAVLSARFGQLEDHEAKDSHNSSKPPSTDAPWTKPRSRRTPSGRKPGGQEGHPGHTLKMAEKPDHEVVHRARQCRHCGESLESTQASGVERRQVFDLPPVRVESTEHRAERKICPHCGKETKADFPEDVRGPVQYGERVQSLAVYLLDYQLVPVDRLAELFEDAFSHTLSVATLMKASETCYESLEPVERRIKELVIASPVVNCDETGCRIGAQRQWLHLASTPTLTCYWPDPKRGCEAIDAMGILPGYAGTAVHDFWTPYLQYPCAHSLCNAHHIRELTFVAEQHQQEWATEMIACLLTMNGAVKTAKAAGRTSLDEAELRTLDARYEAILRAGDRANPAPQGPREPGERGRRRQSKARNLLDRLGTHRKETLAFLYDFDIPFDNNLGERDIRMMKVHEKISGGFRTEHGAKVFARIRGFISTARKQGQRVLGAIGSIFRGQAWMPEPDTG